MQQNEGSRTFYVVFSDSPHRYWWSVFTRKGLRHCSVLEEMNWPQESYLAQEGTLLVESIKGHLEVSVYSKSAAVLLASYTIKGAISAVIKFRVEHKADLGYAPIRFLTCVGAVKAVLGLKARSVFTPRQLFVYLLRNGGLLLWAA